MKEEDILICDFMYNFIDNNWENINKTKCEITKNKIDFLSEVKVDVQTALWVLFEVCRWGMDKVYLNEVFVPLEEYYDFNVIKIGEKYIKSNWVSPYYIINFCEPKTRTVIYFE